MDMPQPPHGPGQFGQHPQGQPPQGPPSSHIPAPPSGPVQAPPPGVPGAPTQQFQTAPGGQWQPAGPPKAQKPPMPKVISAIWVLGLISVAATVIGLTVNEDGVNAWKSVHAWGGLAIVGALLTLAPAVAGSMSMTAHRAWQVAVCGAGALLLFWVLFVLPAVGSNTSLVVTIGAAAGVIAAWIAPGRDVGPAARPDQHTW